MTTLFRPRPALWTLMRLMWVAVIWGATAHTARTAETPADGLLPGFEPAPLFAEQIRWSRLDSGVRVLVVAPRKLAAARRRLVIYATPNGNTIEQTAGCAAKALDWHFDIQHVAAQVRRYREVAPGEDCVLAIVQAPRLSWPTFRREQPHAQALIRDLVDSLRTEVGAQQVTLSGHSGGGSFLFGYLNAVEELPAQIDRLVLLDANYAYTDDQRHGDKLLAWLRGDRDRRLVVVAYDDREIRLDGKKVVGPDGGTYRASQRMMDRFRRDLELVEDEFGAFRHTAGLMEGQSGELPGQLQFFVHPNPDNVILHTALVGEMNGLLLGLTLGVVPADGWGKFGGPRAYQSWIQPLPFVAAPPLPISIPGDAPEVRLTLPDRPSDAPGGAQFLDQIANLPRDQREAAILTEITRGNIPAALRKLAPIRTSARLDDGAVHTITYFVTRDYLAVGTDADSFRLPMAPGTACRIADAAGCSLITTKVSDDVFAAATIRLPPQPFTTDREAAATFYAHHQRIEEQLRAVSAPAAALVAGIKKDVVWTKRLNERPHRTALYGWHHPDGTPIQPLYVGHVDWYVDYSHGIRLLANRVILDGRDGTVTEVLGSSQRHVLLSNEGPLDPATLRAASQW